ncbi:guanylate kinase [Bacteroides sp. 224]|uniref:guanylate kinase n=1 Tax=Bacteroides sp. 224 TaxID=2302936 RepID=UPI0013D3222F|nr:guanylate kinase [Bacteroides sp. 224]NDV64765.1 guanylate kinase [Bacteroides sp. 224]
MKGKLIIFSAPSGSGKSTIINYLMLQNLNLAFSVSATSRLPRGDEQHGVEYFFLTPEEFRERIKRDEFLEHEEVYENCFYGTLKSHIEDLLEAGKNVIFDVDVVGGLNIKRYYGNRALAIFIQPPSTEELRKRLIGRGTDSPEVIEKRLSKATFELSFANQFDKVVINDDLKKACAETLHIVENFIAV